MEEKIKALEHENALLRELVRQSEPDREAKETYERYLIEIGKMIGCGHLDDRLPSCVADAIDSAKQFDRIKAELIRLRRYVMFHGNGIGECVAWVNLKRTFGVGNKDQEDWDWLCEYESREVIS